MACHFEWLVHFISKVKLVFQVLQIYCSLEILTFKIRSKKNENKPVQKFPIRKKTAISLRILNKRQYFHEQDRTNTYYMRFHPHL